MDEMKDRIKHIMDKENLTPAKFADRLQINRAVISHILNGRNNPSLDVVVKILSEMSYINSEWLINGTGKMYKDGFDDKSYQSVPDLFHQIATDASKPTGGSGNSKENGVSSPDDVTQDVESKSIDRVVYRDRKITQIIIYYDDNTFEKFGPY